MDRTATLRWLAIATVLALATIVAACQPAGETPTKTGTGAAPTAGATATSAALATAAPEPAPVCRAPAEPTPSLTEGPFFKSGSPARTSLVERGVAGTAIVLSGYVLSRSCRPVAGALLDFWQADANGVYDNSGFTLRGHQFADAQGRYRLETVLPGEYPGRTPHIHVKVQAPGRAVVTTQLYLPGERRNAGDSFFRPELVVRMDRAAAAPVARFDFVVDVP